ncbi:MAG: sugar phosphate isomerase/epimerase [Chthoniobacter sp.]|nr:sugar phosphate isomerase/epimerase [Chthoniobacter sp.]
MKISLLFLLTLVCGPLRAADANPFFAMNTIARGGAAEVVPLLKELGYAGLGGAVGDGAMATALEREGLKFFNGYHTISFHADRPALDDRLRGQIDAMKDHGTALWLAVARVQDAGRTFPNSSPDGDDVALAKLREIADYAEPRGVKIALYPHATLWLERVEDGIRVAEKLNRTSVGATFNLCHWLKVEGSERDPAPVLKAALPRLMFVTINGADTGDTKAMNWDRLIQPLGAGSYDVAAFLRTVHAAGYTGPIGFQGYGIKAPPREVLTRTMSAWRQIHAPTPAP